MDARSNLFSLGAMFYEMVTERKAFDRDDVESSAPEHSGEHSGAAASRESESASAAQRSDHEGAGKGSGRALPDAAGNCSTIWRSARSQRGLRPRNRKRRRARRLPDKAKAAAQAKFVTPAAANRGQSPLAAVSGAARPATAAPSAKPVVAKPGVARPAGTAAAAPRPCRIKTGDWQSRLRHWPFRRQRLPRRESAADATPHLHQFRN